MDFKKLKKDDIAIFIAIFLIVIYVFYQVYSVTHIELETETALVTTVYDSIDATALVVRDETVLSASDGVTVSCLNDGDKVNVGGNIAMKFASADAASSYSKFTEVEKELAYYENLQSQTVGQTAGIESIDDDIENNVDYYVRAMSNGNPELVEERADLVNEGIFRRQTIIGTDVKINDVVQDLRTKAANYSNSAKPTGFVTTDKSGVFSSYVDGYEDVVDYSKVKELKVKDINSAIEKASSSSAKPDNKTIGKLINSYQWYFVTVVNFDDIKGISKNGNIEIALKNNDDTVIKAKIVAGLDATPDDDGNIPLILRCNYLNGDIASSRIENIEIRNAKYVGIKAPSNAVHVVDGKKGVYVLISSQVKFRQAEIIYSKDDYVLLSYNDDEPNGIRIYDKIITQGKDLEDGKVYT